MASVGASPTFFEAVLLLHVPVALTWVGECRATHSGGGAAKTTAPFLPAIAWPYDSNPSGL
jgi:hypothetical protein